MTLENMIVSIPTPGCVLPGVGDDEDCGDDVGIAGGGAGCGSVSQSVLGAASLGVVEERHPLLVLSLASRAPSAPYVFSHCGGV